MNAWRALWWILDIPSVVHKLKIPTFSGPTLKILALVLHNLKILTDRHTYIYTRKIDETWPKYAYMKSAKMHETGLCVERNLCRWYSHSKSECINHRLVENGWNILFSYWGFLKAIWTLSTIAHIAPTFLIRCFHLLCCLALLASDKSFV